jgi:hypothetical protein
MSIKNIVLIGLSVLVTVGCSSAPSVRKDSGGNYVASGEAEFNINGLVNDVHAKAMAMCKEQGKEMFVVREGGGFGGIGFAGSKKIYILTFRCS